MPQISGSQITCVQNTAVVNRENNQEYLDKNDESFQMAASESKGFQNVSVTQDLISQLDLREDLKNELAIFKGSFQDQWTPNLKGDSDRKYIDDKSDIQIHDI